MTAAKIALALTIACIAGFAQAQDKGGNFACRADVRKFCADSVGGGVRKITDCLIDHQKEISDDCYDALKAHLKKENSGEAGSGEPAADVRSAQPAGPVYRSRQADGRTVYSDTPQLNAPVQKEVPMDRVIYAPPPR